MSVALRLIHRVVVACQFMVFHNKKMLHTYHNNNNNTDKNNNNNNGNSQIVISDPSEHFLFLYFYCMLQTVTLLKSNY